MLYQWLSRRTSVKLESDLNFKLLPEEPEFAHLLLELLNNAARYQGLTEAIIKFEDATITACFVGRSTPRSNFEANRVKLGTAGIKERLEILGASLEFTDSGFLLRLGSDNG
jgi:hypothetical protein